MIAKRLRASYWDDDKPAATLLDVLSNGFDSDQLEKLAAADDLTFLEIKPERGYAFVHVVTTGAGEYYGPNNNADFFNENSRVVEFPNGLEKSAAIDEGLSKYHKTYREYGAVYRNHFNSKKGGEPEGEIVWETFNPDLHRGELVIKLAEDKWSDDLEKLASGEPLYWSQGCGVPYDICSICGNKAKTRANYCDHLRFQKLAIDTSGNQVYAINDKPHFHDISRVLKPADRIAFGLQKVASIGSVNVVDDYIANEEGLYIPANLVRAISSKKEADRYDILQKLAKLENGINLHVNKGLKSLSESFIKTAEEEDKIVKDLEGIPLDKLFSSLLNNNEMLTPNTFVRIVIHKKPKEVEGVKGFPKALESIFGDLLEDGNLEDLTNDGSYMPGFSYPDRSVEDKVKGLSESLSLDEEPVKHRIVKITVIGKPDKMEKESMMDEPTPAAKYLAKEYAKYQLTFLANSDKRENNLMLAVLQNQTT